MLALQEARIRADPGEALRALEGYQPDGSAYDDLAALLESILCLAASDQAAAEGRLPYAKSLAARGREALTRCAFPAGDLVQGALLREAELAGGPDFLPAAKAWVRDRETVLLARLSLAQDCPARALALLEGVPDQSLLQGPGSLPLGPISGGIGASALCRGSGQRRKRLLLSGSCWRPAAGSLAITGALMNTPPSSAHRRGPDLLKVGQHASYPLCFHPSPGACIPGRLFV